MKAALMTAMLFVGQVVGSSASANTACICEMGTEPANQHAGFSAGCSIWLKQQKDCGTKQKVEQGVDYRALNIDPTADTIKIGYVGHWYHSQQLVSYLSLRIAPLMSARAVSVSIDNTACRAMNNPQIVFDYVKGMNLPANQTLSVRGFQTESMGKWDVVFGKDMSVPAEVSSTAEQIAYPACKPFMNRNCVHKIVIEESATCVGKSGELEKIQCCPVLGGRYAWAPAGC